MDNEQAAKFNPNDFMMDFKGRPYLQVAHRVLWFKMENGHDGSITTDLIRDTPFPIYKATISVHGVVVATGHGTAQSSQKQTVWSGKEFEKAETAAIGRALANAGYGTQFSEMLDDDSGDNIVDSPATTRNKASSKPVAQSNGNGAPTHSQASQNGASNGKPQKGAEEFPNPLVISSIYYNKGKDGAYMLFRGKDNPRLTVSSFGGREKLIDAMSFSWSDATLDAIKGWESGKVYPVPETAVKWEQKDGHKVVVSLQMVMPA